MKKILGLLAILLIVNCSSESREYREFVTKYGSETRTYCDGLFLMRETFLSPQAQAPQEYLINSNKCK